MTTKKVDLGIYPAVVIATTSEGEYKRLYAKRIKRGAIDLSHCDGMSSDRDGYYLVGVFDGEHGTLVHELAHTVFKILHRVNVPASFKHQEAFAYLQQWLYGELHPILTKGD